MMAIAVNPNCSTTSELTESPTMAPATPNTSCHVATESWSPGVFAIVGRSASWAAPERLLSM